MGISTAFRNRRVAGLLGAAVLTALLGPYASAAPTAGQRGAEAEPNDDPAFLQVYDANVENLPTANENCPGDWHDLMYYMRQQALKPDVYLVQQVSGQEQLDLLLARMKEHFGEEYAGVVAEKSPAAGGGVCGSDKTHQTNAVIWRKARLDLKLSDSPGNRWQAQGFVPPPGDPDGERACRNNDQARTKGVKALLRDKVSGKSVTAASFHWRTKEFGKQCAESNAAELSNELTQDGYGAADLYLAGGDSNFEDSENIGDEQWTPWYRQTNGDLGGAHGFRDAVFTGCSTAAAGPVGECLEDKWTLLEPRPRRIDYLLGRKPGGAMPRTTGTVVPTFDEGDQADLDLTGTDDPDLDYSDHRAVGARIHY